MRRFILAAACILLLPAVAQATAYSVTLTGNTGSGFATIDVSGDDIDYNILVSGFAPDTAVLSDGSNEIDLGTSFVGGTAVGTATSEMASEILADPSSWTLEVGGGSETISGALSGGGGGGATTVYFPVAATTSGAQGTNWKTDGRVVNRSGEAASVTFEYYPDGENGNSSPSDTETFTVAANEQVVLTNFVENFFGVTNGKGGVKVMADRAVTASAQVYNDQTDAGDGTYGLFVEAVDISEAYTSGVIPFLQNRRASSEEGFRGAVGWFNPTSATVNLTLRAWDTDGTYLGETSKEVAGLAQQQFAVQGLWSSLAGYGDMYISYSADGSIFVYGTITDNKSGDGSYIPATLSP